MKKFIKYIFLGIFMACDTPIEIVEVEIETIDTLYLPIDTIHVSQGYWDYGTTPIAEYIEGQYRVGARLAVVRGEENLPDSAYVRFTVYKIGNNVLVYFSEGRGSIFVELEMYSFGGAQIWADLLIPTLSGHGYSVRVRPFKDFGFSPKILPLNDPSIMWFK